MRITEKAMLVKLSISLPGNNRQDRKLTSEIKVAKALGHSAGKWVKQLYPDGALDPVSRLQNEARTWHYKHSLPWGA